MKEDAGVGEVAAVAGVGTIDGTIERVLKIRIFVANFFFKKREKGAARAL